MGLIHFDLFATLDLVAQAPGGSFSAQARRIFGSGTVPSNLTLAEPALTSPARAVLLHYELASGIPRTGDKTRELTRT